jgi:redox-sensitive bicupin YhaK (pirin superfamily)
MKIRKSSTRGKVERSDGIYTINSFVCDGFYDPRYLGYSRLRAIDMEFFAPHTLWKDKEHNSYERLLFVLDGVLNYRDHLGHEAEITKNEIAFVKSGTELFVTKENKQDTPLKLLSIGIWPNDPEGESQFLFKKDVILPIVSENYKCLASSKENEGFYTVNQDTLILYADLKENDEAAYTVENKRNNFIFVIEGSIEVREQILNEGDMAMFDRRLEKNAPVLKVPITNTAGEIRIKTTEKSKFLFFDMPSLS